jgi:hypothetical protein
VSCPDCGSSDIAKAIMAPNVVARRRGKKGSATADPRPSPCADVLHEIRRALLAQAEDVGAHFPDEARKIHYGEAEPRIHGTASAEEARTLLDEGIEILAVPPLPEDAN